MKDDLITLLGIILPTTLPQALSRNCIPNIMQINLSPRFKRSYKKCPPHIQIDFDKKIALFMSDPYTPSLRTHKLKGNLQTCLSFYLKDGFRVLFEFGHSNSINLLDIGPHDIYERY